MHVRQRGERIVDCTRIRRYVCTISRWGEDGCVHVEVGRIGQFLTQSLRETGMQRSGVVNTTESGNAWTRCSSRRNWGGNDADKGSSGTYNFGVVSHPFVWSIKF